MAFARVRRFLFIGLLLVACGLLATVAHRHRLLQQAWFELSHWLAPAVGGLELGQYRAVVQRLPIAGLPADVSALTYDRHRQTLFTVTNKNPELIELSLNGEVLRRVALRGFGDPEAVEYISPGVFVISDEREQRLVRVVLGEAATELDAQAGQQLSVALGRNGNKGFEGLAYDSRAQRLYVAKERDPMRIYEVDGFAAPRPEGIHIAENPERDARLFVRDLSSLQFDEASGHLLALSDESSRVLELNPDGHVVGSLSLRQGSAGLEQAMPQGEGMAMDEQGTLYMVSEPNLFYVFKKPSAP